MKQKFEDMNLAGSYRRAVLASFDIEPPVDFLTLDKALMWESYLSCLTPFRRLEKFGECLDILHSEIEKTRSVEAAPSDKMRLYGLWTASSIAMAAVSRMIGYSEYDKKDQFKSDIEETIFCAERFLKDCGAAGESEWARRREKHRELCGDDFGAILSDVSKVIEKNKTGDAALRL